MERWWDRMLVLPDALEPLCSALADVCRRIGEYHAIMAARGVSAVHADIKPRNAVLARDGRWLLTDFGAAKSRPIEQETWEATRLILGTENFIAPEMLFNARKRHPQAMDTWSVGATLFALLKMRRHRLFGQELPVDGTHNILFRCQRMSTVTDLRERMPNLFVGRDLDPAAFFSPDRLPDEDRQTIAQALLGVFGVPDERRERILEREILALLDMALAIDPARRFTRAEDMSRAFDRIVQRYWELEGSLREPPADVSVTYELTETETMRSENEFDEGRPTVVAPDPAALAAPVAPPRPAEIPTAEDPITPPPSFEAAGGTDDRTVLATDAPSALPLPAAPESPFPASGAIAIPPPVVPPDEAEFAPQTIVPPFEAEEPAPPPAATWAGEVEPPVPPPAPASFHPAPSAPPPAPEVADERVLRLLEGIQAQLAKRPPNRPTPPPRTPTWQVLAIGLLLFCQAIQFGLLLYMSFGERATFGRFDAVPLPATPTASVPAAPEPAPAAVETPTEPSEVAAPDPTEDPVPAELVAEPLAPEPVAIAAAEPQPPPQVAARPAPEPVAPKPAASKPAEPKPAEPKPAAQTSQKSTSASTGASSAAKPKPATSSEPASGSTTRSSSAASSPRAEAAPAPAGAGDGTIEVLGAQAYVVGAAGRKSCGGLPAGTYEIFAQPADGAEYLSLGVHTLAAGQHMTFRCGFGSCRRLQ
jgi:hypothetical protein